MKRILTAAVVVLAAALVSAAVLPMALRGRIEAVLRHEAFARLDARFDFRRLDVSLLRHFPNASFELKDLTLTGTGRFAGDTLVSASRLSVVVDLFSLFGDGGYEAAKVKLVRPVVHVRKRPDGAVNWHILKSDSTSAPGTPPFSFALRRVRVADAAVRYDDDSMHLSFTASPVTLRLKGELSAPHSDLDLFLAFRDVRAASGGRTLMAGTDVVFDALIGADMVNRRFILRENTLRLNAVAVPLRGRIDLSNPRAAAVDLHADCADVRFKDLLSTIPFFYTRDFNNLTASGELTLAAWVRGEVRGSLLPAFEVRLDVHEGRFQYTSLPKAVTGITVTARAASRGGTLDNAVFEVPDFSLKMAGNPLRASFSVSNLLSDPHFDLSAAGRLDLETVHKVFPHTGNRNPSGLITADIRVAGRLSDIDSQRYEAVDASGAFVVERLDARIDGLPAVRVRRAAATVSSAAMTLGELDVTVGRSDFSANGQLTGYIGSLLDGMPLSGRLYVKSELVDMNEFMTTIPSSEEADTVTTTAIIVPRNLNLQLTADVHRVLLRRTTLSDLTGEFRTAGGTAWLDRLSMKAFGGSMFVSGSYSSAVNPRRPYLTLALDVTHASFSRTFEELDLVQQFAPLFRNASGDYSMTLDMASQLGPSMSPDLRSFGARGELRAPNILIRDVEAFAKLADVLHSDKLRTIDAKDVKIRFSVARGRLTTQPFDLRMGPVSVNLSGWTEPGGRTDYAARILLPLGRTQASIDASIGGTFAEPQITLGAKPAAREPVQPPAVIPSDSIRIRSAADSVM